MGAGKTAGALLAAGVGLAGVGILLRQWDVEEGGEAPELALYLQGGGWNADLTVPGRAILELNARGVVLVEPGETPLAEPWWARYDVVQGVNNPPNHDWQPGEPGHVLAAATSSQQAYEAEFSFQGAQLGVDRPVTVTGYLSIFVGEDMVWQETVGAARSYS